MALSQNGWTAFTSTSGNASRRQVPGTDVWLTVHNGTAGDLLIWVAEQFDKRVESIDNGRGTIDDGAWNYRQISGSTALSNHASATAIDLNWSRHPLGAVGTFNGAQVTAIRQIISETGGAIRWGGSYSGRKDEMHFEIDTDQAGCNRAWAAIQERQNRTEEEEMPLMQLDLHGMKVGERRQFTVPWGNNQVVLSCDGGIAKIRGVYQIDHDGSTRGWDPMFGPDWGIRAHYEREIRSEQQGTDNAFKLPRRVCKVSFQLLEMTPTDPEAPEEFSMSALMQYWELGA